MAETKLSMGQVQLDASVSENNYTIVGNPIYDATNETITIHPNFATPAPEKEFFYSNVNFAPGNNTWELRTRIKILADSVIGMSYDPNFIFGLGNSGSGNPMGILLGKSNNSNPNYIHLKLWISTNGYSWDVQELLSEKYIPFNTDVSIKFYYTGTQYKVDCSETGAFAGEEENFFTIDLATPFYQGQTAPIMCGSNPFEISAENNADCTFYLQDTFAVVNGETIWKAAENYKWLYTKDKNIPNGIAGLDENALVSAYQIPVDNSTITVENGKLKASGGGSVPDNVYTKTNLFAGKGITFSITEGQVIKATASAGAYAYTASKLTALHTANKWSFKFKLKFTIPNGNNAQWIFGNSTGYYDGPQLLILNVDGNYKFTTYMSSNGGNFDISTDYIKPTWTLVDGHVYECSFDYSSSGYTLTAKDIDANITYNWTINSTTDKIYDDSELFFLNNHCSPSTLEENYFQGVFYWDSMKVVIDDVVVFDGATAALGIDYINSGLSFVTEGQGTAGSTLINTTAEFEKWQKSSSWVDLRSGALPNSVYYLVGHSADYATYPTFTLYAEVSDSGTYDVYVDGIKKASAVTSGTATTLSWQTLALTTGYDVTYPSALRTHIVRLTPTDSTKTINILNNANGDALTLNGLLWAHFTTENYINLRYAFYNAAHLEAVTSKDVLNVATLFHAFEGCSLLQTVPAFDGKNQQYLDGYNAFNDCAKLKKVAFENFIPYRASTYMFRHCAELKEISAKNSFFKIYDQNFSGCAKLKQLPPLMAGGAVFSEYLLAGCTSLENTVLDLSGESSLIKLSVGATSSARVDGLKGLLVSSSAPFTSSPYINVSYTGLERGALVALFESLPTVSDSQIINVTGCAGAADLTNEDKAIATAKGWTVTL